MLVFVENIGQKYDLQGVCVKVQVGSDARFSLYGG